MSGLKRFVETFDLVPTPHEERLYDLIKDLRRRVQYLERDNESLFEIIKEFERKLKFLTTKVQKL